MHRVPVLRSRAHFSNGGDSIALARIRIAQLVPVAKVREGKNPLFLQQAVDGPRGDVADLRRPVCVPSTVALSSGEKAAATRAGRPADGGNPTVVEAAGLGKKEQNCCTEEGCVARDAHAVVFSVR